MRDLVERLDELCDALPFQTNENVVPPSTDL